MLGRDFAGTSANIGLGAMQKATLKPNEPNLGVMLANGIKAYDNNQKKQAYVDALQGGDQDAINKAWADYDADGYAQYLQNKEATQTDFANKLAMLDKQNEYATGLENLRNSNAYGLAKFSAGLQEQALAAEIARKNDEIAKNDAIAQEMLNNGQISDNQYNLWRLTRNEKALGIGNSEKETQNKNYSSLEDGRIKKIGDNMDENINKAEENLRNFKEADSLLNDIETGGLWGYAKSQMNPAFLNDKEAQYLALVNKITPQMRPVGSGSTSDKDMEVFRGATFGLDKPKEANRNIIQGAIAANENDIAKEEIRANLIKRGVSTSDFDKEWRTYLNKNPIFTNNKGELNPNRVNAYDYFAGLDNSQMQNEQTDPLGLR